MNNPTLVRWIFLTFSLSIGTVVALVVMSEELRDSSGSFLRVFPPHPVMEGDTLAIRYDSYYIAGGTPSTVYLGNSTAPLHLLEVNLETLDTVHVRLRIKNIKQQKFWAPRLQVDSPFYYLTDGAVPVLYRGNVNTWEGERYLSDSTYFRSIIPLTHRSFIVKSLNGTTGENILGKLTAWSPYPQFRADILQKQIDGVFCTDGMMHYNKALNRIFYLYYYRNEFIVIDTSLTVQYSGHTIDTNSFAKINPVLITSTHTRVLSSPPLYVNLGCHSNEHWLFIHSALRARNEAEVSFNRSSTIDVYTLPDGKYTFSYHVYPYSDKKMIEFRVYGNRMIVLYDKLLRVFDLVPRYFNTPPDSL